MENGPTLFTKVLIFKEVEVSSLFGSRVALEIDESYKIGKSVAVLHKGNVIGHLEKGTTRMISRHLRSGSCLEAVIYRNVGSCINKRWFSIMSYSFEIGVKIQFTETTREDGILILAHITKKKLNSFPAVEVDNCPIDLDSTVNPVKDENGVSSLQFPPDTN